MKHLRKIGIILLFLISVTRTQSQVQADFTATPLSGCAPLVVRFQDQSSGSITSRTWDLGNGTISTLTNPTTTYFNPGVYPVKLVVRGASGVDSIIKTNYITVFALPEAKFEADDSIGCYPLTVNFTDQSTTAAGSISSWSWDFGDGTISSQRNPSHTYTFSGDFTVTLRIVSSNGCISSVAKQRHIKVGDGVNADFFAPISSACKPPVNIPFTNLSTGPGTLTYAWNFGNGQTSTQRNPTARFDNAGDFIVTLIATSTSGCTDTIQKPVSIPASTIQSSFTSPDTACIRQQVSFTNTSLPDPDSTFWSFGDGSTSLAFSPNKTYNTPGVYNVRLRNKFGTCVDTFVKTIVIVDTPRAAFTNSIAVACKPPFSVKFTDQSTGATSWLWEFSDGTTSTARHPDKIFNTFGTFSVKLTVTNRNGCKSSITKTGLIQIARPTFTVRNLPDSGCVPFTVNPIIDVNAVDTVASYFWNFGNGTTSTNPRPSVTYNTAGEYTIKLVIRTKGGCTDSISIPGIKAGMGNVVVANFVADPLTICAGQPIQFTDQSTGTPTGWLWDFGDGTTSEEQNPVHSYTDTGFFDITLVAYNSGCPSELKREKYVRITGAVARFGYQINCNNRNQMTFLDSSVNAATWFWDFKDGTTSTEKSPTHTFPGVGHYPVSLTVTRDGCTHTYSRDIYIVDERAQYNVTPDVLCRGTDVTFNAIVNQEDAIGQYEWDFGNGVYVIGPKSPVFNYAGFANGNYTTRLRIIDFNGCFDSTSKVIKIGGPTARFGMDVTSGCKGLRINFTDSSYADNDNAIVTRIWDFGDGTIQTINSGPVQHSYLNPGSYTVKLKVIDAAGCADSLVLRNQIIITEPKASFYANDTITCPLRPIQFINTSTATVNNFTWTFGDGTGSTVKNPAHIYNAVGAYTVTLKIRDRFGCEDSMTRVSYIVVDTPYAAFTVSDSVGTCPPLEVKFTFTGKHNQTIKWDFGDGGASTLLNPTHFYSIPGTYQARLIVTSPGGCRDTAFKTITVYGPNGTLSYTPLGGCSPLTVNFNVTTQNVDSILWDFADGNTLFNKDSVLSYTYSDSGLYTPRVILQDALGCRVPIKGVDPIKVTRTFPDFDTDIKLLCDRGIVQFYDSTSGNGAVTGWLWNFGDGGSSAQQNPQHTYTAPGVYNVTLIVTTEFGCTDTISKPAFISVVSSPVTAITASQDSICVNGSITFQGVLVQPDTSALTWSWNFANGQGSALQNPPAQQYNQAGTFNVQLITTNSSGCKDTADFPISVQPLPLTDAGPDTTICLGQSVQLNGTGATTYQWSPAATLSCTTCPTPVATPSVNTMYYLSGQTAFGCTTTDSVLVSVIQPTAVIAPADDSLCAGQSIELVATGTAFYSWSPSTGLSNPNIANPVASPASTTSYVVTGSDVKGCFITTDTVTISVFPYPVVEAGRDTTIPVGFFTPLNAQISPDVINIQWSPTVGLSCSTCPNPVASPTFNTSYTITVSNSGGCSSSDVVTIRVVCNNANIFMPNTFSPNGDGMNDIYYPRGRGINTIRSLRIFNRWGQLVFEKKNFNANDASAGWDGTFKGARLSPDVYVYIMDLSCENNSIITMKGDITLIR